MIIVVEKNKDGKIELTEEQLNELIEKAYNEGKENGRGTFSYPLYPYLNPKCDPIPTTKPDDTFWVGSNYATSGTPK